MICPTCKGGKTLLKKEQCKGCYEVVIGICDRCHGTGEVEMTNEEYIRQASTEELAEIFFEVYMTDKHHLYSRIESAEYEHGIGVGGRQELMRWLKEKHE